MRVTLSISVDRVEHERQFLTAKHASTISKVGKEQPSSEPSNPASESKNELQELRKQLEFIAKKVERFTSNRQRYCSYCCSNSHDQRECTRSPPPGHCFDCLRKYCRRWHPNCPGKKPQPSRECLGSLRNTSPTISIAVNGRIMQAQVDTGSGHTLIKKSVVET